jgi:PAS domain S-box-containing protein
MQPLPQNQFIQKYVITLVPETSVEFAIQLMNQKNTNYVLILEQSQIVGIFSQRDLIKAIASGINLSVTTLADVMVDNVITVKQSELGDLLSIIRLLHHQQISYLPVLDHNEQLLGVITHQSIQQVLAEELECCEYVGQKQEQSADQIDKILSNTSTIFSRIRLRSQEELDTELALRESEERLQLALEASGDGLWDWKIPTEEVYFSPRWYEMLGYNVGELPYEFNTWEKLVHPEDRAWVKEILYSHLRDSSVPYSFEYRMLTKSGKCKWIANYGKVVMRDKNGQPLRMIGIHRDISDRKLAEQVLQEREAFLRAIGDNIPNGYIFQMVRELDGRNRFYYISAGVERVNNLKPEAIVADSSLLFNNILLEDIPDLLQKQQESIQTMSVFDIQLREYSPEGEIRWVRLCSTPRPMDDGRICWDGIRLDITDLKNTEETLRQSKALLTEAQHIAQIGNWEFDLNTQKITWTEELFHILNRDPALKEPTYEENLELYQPEDAENLHQAVQKAISTGESYSILLKLKPLADGSIRYIESFAYTELNSRGEVIRLYGTAQNITERFLAEQALQEKEKFLRSIYNGVEQCIFVVDILEDGTFCFAGVNHLAERLSGMRSVDMQGKTPEDLFPPAMASLVRQHYQDCVAAKETLTYEECLPFQGKDSWWITSLTPLFNEHGRIYRLIGSSIEISDRKRLELALKTSEKRLKNILSTASASIFSFRIFSNLDWEYEYQSTASEIIFGYSATELLADKMLWLSRVCPEDREKVMYSRFLQSVTEGACSVEYRFRHKDGSLRWISTTYSAHRQETFDGWIVIGVSIDISDRKRAEEALRRSENLFRTLSDSAPIGIFRSDAQGKNIYTNPRFQAICGLSLAASLGDGWMQFIHPEDLAEFLPQLDTLATANQELSAEVRYILADSTLRFCRIMIVPILSEPNELVGYVGTIEDITENRAIEKMKKEFISIVSHELRTPLASIRGALGLLSAGVLQAQPATAQQMLEIAYSDTERLVRLVNDILDLEHLESNKFTIVKQWCDTATILRQSLEAVQPLATENQISLAMLPNSVQVCVDSDRIMQTLVNLIGNAIKFSPANSTVTLNVEDLGDRVLFKVQDQGKGIPENMLENIFGRFQQVDASDSRQKGGTGLGLAICRGIVQQHGGKIWAESVLGKGSIFYFTIPKFTNR